MINESKIVNIFFKYLNDKSYFFAHTKNDNNINGFFDYTIFLKNGSYIFIEFKRNKTQKLRDSQLKWMKIYQKYHFNYYIIKSIEDITKFFVYVESSLL